MSDSIPPARKLGWTAALAFAGVLGTGAGGAAVGLATTWTKGIATRGDVEQSTAVLAAEIAKCVRRDELGAAPKHDETPLWEHVTALEAEQRAQDFRLGRQVRESASNTAATYTAIGSRSREAWRRARAVALTRFDAQVLESHATADQAREYVLRQAGVPR